ncbi:MAG TPA: Dabb family protein [Bryobacteraceae bacterium]|nr:Dabb family protein [Bryobacteraceae bacterium]
MKLVLLACLFATATWAQSSSVIHIIHVKWKIEASPEQIQAAVERARQLPSKYPGIKRVWTKNLKYEGQEGFKQAIVMEFESQDALRKYENSLAQKWWYEAYLPVREDSRTDDVTN